MFSAALAAVGFVFLAGGSRRGWAPVAAALVGAAFLAFALSAFDRRACVSAPAAIFEILPEPDPLAPPTQLTEARLR